jgi:hypothetical protein
VKAKKGSKGNVAGVGGGDAMKSGQWLMAGGGVK